MKQNEKTTEKKQVLEELVLRIEDVEQLIDEVSEIAYEKAVEAVVDKVRTETKKEDMEMISEYKKWILEPERKAPKDKREYTAKRLDTLMDKISMTAQKAVITFKHNLMKPELKKAGTEQVREKARESVRERLASNLGIERNKKMSKEIIALLQKYY